VGYASGVGRKAPPFTLPTMDGGRVSLADYRGDWFPVLVFFSEDDGRTAAEFTALGSAADRLWGLRGQVLGVVATAGDDVVGDGAPGGGDVPALIDAGGAVARSYGARVDHDGRLVPLACIVDRAGRIVWTGRPGSDDLPTQVVRAFRDVVR